MYKQVKTEEDLDALVEIAYEIWSTHFADMFDAETLAKLIEGVQSKAAISIELKNAYKYFLIKEKGQYIGYFAYKIIPEEKELFLNKLYIYSAERGHGVGRQVLKYLEGVCRKSALDNISLTVFHKNINSVKAYEKWGFENLGLIKKIFSKDLIFDDYKMRKMLVK